MVPPSLGCLHSVRCSISHIRLNRYIQADSQLYLSSIFSVKYFTGLRKCAILGAQPAAQQNGPQLTDSTPERSNSVDNTLHHGEASVMRRERSASCMHLFPQLYRKHRVQLSPPWASVCSLRTRFHCGAAVVVLLGCCISLKQRASLAWQY